MLFVDTSYWIALGNARDARHATAIELGRKYRGELLVTSNLVLGETWTIACRRGEHRTAVAWLDQLLTETALRLQRIGTDLEAEGWAWLRVRDERRYSFVDATSFALMRKLRIREALAFDQDFAAAGFVELRP